jgi:hypothetical protein
MKTMAFLLLITLTNLSAQEKPQNADNVIVKYKQYESFDLGALEIQGNIIAPGDLTVGERDRKKFSRNLYERYDFNNETREDILNFR